MITLFLILILTSYSLAENVGGIDFSMGANDNYRVPIPYEFASREEAVHWAWMARTNDPTAYQRLLKAWVDVNRGFLQAQRNNDLLRESLLEAQSERFEAAVEVFYKRWRSVGSVFYACSIPLKMVPK